MRGRTRSLGVTIATVMALALAACVGDSGTPQDGGSDAGTGTDGPAPDVAPGKCAFGSSHFGDDCKFGP